MIGVVGGGVLVFFIIKNSYLLKKPYFRHLVSLGAYLVHFVHIGVGVCMPADLTWSNQVKKRVRIKFRFHFENTFGTIRNHSVYQTTKTVSESKKV